MVSIHAPVKGRRHRMRAEPLRDRFNPRPREGATRHKVVIPHLGDVSIHAPVKGRHLIVTPWRSIVGFNPRPREGATFVQMVSF